MKTWIINSYLDRKNHTYQFFYWLNKRFYLWLVLLFSCVISYPLFWLMSNKMDLQQNTQTISDLREKVQQNQKLLASMLQHFQQKNQTDLHFTEINSQLKTLFEKFQLQPETLQWQLEAHNTLYLTLTHKSTTLFNVLLELNNISNLFAKEITLTKLHQQQLVQLNASFILIH